MSKPRNKRYRPRQIKVPMTAASTARLELQWYVHLDGFMREPTPDRYNHMVGMVAIVERAMAAQDITDYDVHIRSTKRALLSVCERFEQSGQLRIDRLERATLDAGAGFIEAAIKRMRFDTFAVANHETTTEFRRQDAAISVAA